MVGGLGGADLQASRRRKERQRKGERIYSTVEKKGTYRAMERRQRDLESWRPSPDSRFLN